jgi:D-aminopeptidase
MDRRTFLKLVPATMLPLKAPLRVLPAGRHRARDLGIRIGRMQPGQWNAITDVPGVRVGHSTIIRGKGPLQVGIGPVRTGVTAIWPHDEIANQYLPVGFHILNGNGEVTGLTQAASLGIIGSPIFLTNTSSIGMVYDAYQSKLRQDIADRIVPIVGETWDAFLNDIEGRHVHAEHVYEAMKNAASGPVQEGNVGGGTGMICYQFKGGIGTASRRLMDPLEKYTLGVLVQANHGVREYLRIDGVPIGEEIMDKLPEPEEASYTSLSSILMIVATDAPLLDYQLDRIAKRAAMGLAKTGSFARDSSGDFILSFSTSNRIRKEDFWKSKSYPLATVEPIDINPLFIAASEATEEAIVNALFMANDMEGRDGHKVYALPIERVLKIMDRHRRLFPSEEQKVANLSIY